MEVLKVVDKPMAGSSDDDLGKIIEACAGRDFDGRRDEALVRFLLDTGCRVSELCPEVAGHGPQRPAQT